jgi:hypothetical protein
MGFFSSSFVSGCSRIFNVHKELENKNGLRNLSAKTKKKEVLFLITTHVSILTIGLYTK